MAEDGLKPPPISLGGCLPLFQCCLQLQPSSVLILNYWACWWGGGGRSHDECGGIGFVSEVHESYEQIHVLI